MTSGLADLSKAKNNFKEDYVDIECSEIRREQTDKRFVQYIHCLQCIYCRVLLNKYFEKQLI